MTKNTLSILFSLALALAAGAWAQPPDFAVFPGDERARHGRGQAERLERLVDYLELSEAQATQWRAITETHGEAARARFEQVRALRREFSERAEQAEPNLEELGRIALDLHRQMESLRVSRDQLESELREILTPDQDDRFEALQVARQLSERGERHRERGEWKRARPD